MWERFVLSWVSAGRCSMAEIPVMGLPASDAGDLYIQALRHLRAAGEDVAPRGKPTREYGPLLLDLVNPGRPAPFVYGRLLNPFLMLAEGLWILTGHDEVAFLERYSRSIGRYVRAGAARFEDAYGPRLGRGQGSLVPDQLRGAIEVLSSDRSSRRAVLSLWRPEKDLVVEVEAVPCNVMVDLKVRGDGLRMTVMNRANDLHIGLLFNVLQFGMLGEYVAAALKVPFARQTHITTALHLYTESPIESRLTSDRLSKADVYPGTRHIPFDGCTDQQLRQMYEMCDDDRCPTIGQVQGVAGGSEWAAMVTMLLTAQRHFVAGDEARDYDAALNALDCAPRCDWWVLAAEMFHRRLARRLETGAEPAFKRLLAMVQDRPAEEQHFIHQGATPMPTSEGKWGTGSQSKASTGAERAAKSPA